MIKYYLWIKAGDKWQANGNLHGYDTIEELIDSNEDSLKNYKYKILEALEVQVGTNNEEEITYLPCYECGKTLNAYLPEFLWDKVSFGYCSTNQHRGSLS